ncbi:Cupredoxin [Hyaloscypha sp. PMI_1271]|nr:Cupredoxin [Hyaloscypha sp. PMI_1271]
MRHATPISFFLFSLPLTVLSKSINHDITVGPALSFSPNTTSASAGDTLTFHFFPGKHDVAQSSFSTPCAPSPNGFYSGFIVPDSGEDSTKFVVTVNDTQPIWFYCSEVMHCQLGMVGVVNPPASGDALASYALAASKTTDSTTPANVAGGVFSSVNGPPSASTSTSASPPTSTTTSTGTETKTSSTSTPTQSTSAGAVLGSGNLFLNGMSAVVAVAAVWASLI